MHIKDFMSRDQKLELLWIEMLCRRGLTEEGYKNATQVAAGPMAWTSAEKEEYDKIMMEG